MAAILKICFVLLLPIWKVNWLKNIVGVGATCRSKLFQSEIQDGHHGGHLKSLFCVSSPEPKGQLTLNLVESIGATCRSKIDKIVLIGNPRCPSYPELNNFIGNIGETCRSKIAKIILIRNQRWPPWWPSWKSVLSLISWTERPID